MLSIDKTKKYFANKKIEQKFMRYDLSELQANNRWFFKISLMPMYSSENQ